MQSVSFAVPTSSSVVPERPECVTRNQRPSAYGSSESALATASSHRNHRPGSRPYAYCRVSVLIALRRIRLGFNVIVNVSRLQALFLLLSLLRRLWRSHGTVRQEARHLSSHLLGPAAAMCGHGHDIWRDPGLYDQLLHAAGHRECHAIGPHRRPGHNNLPKCDVARDQPSAGGQLWRADGQSGRHH